MRSIGDTALTLVCEAWRFRVGVVRRGSAVLLLALAVGNHPCPAQPREPAPPPEGSTVEEALLHVLAAELGAWRRPEEVRVFEAAQVAEELPDDAETVLDYDFELGARASYVNADTKAGAEATLLAFRTSLDALGVFARYTEGMTQQLSTTAAGYLEGATLHLHAGCFYLRVVPRQEREGGPQEAQSLAADLEPRLPPVTDRPRLTRILPRRWLNPLRLDYRQVDLFGEEDAPTGLIGEGELADQTVQLVAVRVPDAEEARRYYQRMVAQFREACVVASLPQLGEEAFVAEHPSWGTCAGMLQDEFVAAALGARSAKDAEVLMRLVGIRIRTTRPLPTLPDPQP